jgi:hypothetical protein
LVFDPRDLGRFSGVSANKGGAPIIERNGLPGISVCPGRASSHLTRRIPIRGNIELKEKDPMRSTRDVIDNHLKCFGSKNLEGILSDYSATAVLFAPEGVLKGPDAIKPLFQRMLVEFTKPGASFEMKQISIDGEYAHIVWSAETVENVYELGTDTFFVRNGKIAVQSFAGKITPRK